MIYGITDKPKTFKEWALYSLQQVAAVFCATILISTFCGTPVSSCLFGACVGTIVYQLVTGFKSPMFISSCGATVGAVSIALWSISDGNYLLVVVGGVTIAVVYGVVALLVMKNGPKIFAKIFPPAIVGAITIVIGVNLASYIPIYVQVGWGHSNTGILIALGTMLVTAISAHYLKGFWKTIPFLIGLVFGYILSLACGIVKFNEFRTLSWERIFVLPEFTFMYWNRLPSWEQVWQTVLLFIPVSLAAVCEHYSDHKVLSNIIGTDLTKTPGLHRTLLGDGLASFAGTVVCGLPNTSYGESIATTGMSQVASSAVITVAALIMGALSFVRPFVVLLKSIPNCVFGGLAMILYGYIASSGIKTLQKVDLDNTKNLIIFSVVLTTGLGASSDSAVWLFNEAFSGVALAMVIGIILNLILREKKQ